MTSNLAYLRRCLRIVANGQELSLYTHRWIRDCATKHDCRSDDVSQMLHCLVEPMTREAITERLTS